MGNVCNKVCIELFAIDHFFGEDSLNRSSLSGSIESAELIGLL